MKRPFVLIALILCASLYAAAASGSIGKTEKKDDFWMLIDFQERDLLKTIGITGKSSRPQAIHTMEQALLKHKDAKIRVTCAMILGRLESKSSSEPLKRALWDADTEVRKFSALSLGFLKDKSAFDPLMQLYHKEPEARTRQAIVAALETMDHKDSGSMLAKILVSDKSLVVRQVAAKSIGVLMEKRAWKQLIQALDDPEPRVRGEAAKTLGLLKERRARDKLIELLQDENAYVRQYAVGALSKLKDKKALKPLIAVLKDEDLKVRQWAAGALGGIGSSKALKPLEEMAKNDPEKKAREAAENAIKAIKKSK